MPRVVEVLGEATYHFPDDATDEEIHGALSSPQSARPPLPPGFAWKDDIVKARPPLPPGFTWKDDREAMAARRRAEGVPRGTDAMPPPGLVGKDELPASKPQSPSAGPPVGGAAPLAPSRNALREALLARRLAAGGASLGSMGPEALQAAGAAVAPPMPQTEAPPFLEGTPQALGAGVMDVVRSAAAMPRVAARLGEGIADAVLGEAAGAIVRKLGAIAPQRVAGDLLDEKLLKPASEFYEGGKAARRDAREAPVGEKLEEPGWLLRQGLRQLPQLAASLGSAGAANAPRLARLAAPFVMESGETARNLEEHEARTGERIDNLRFGAAVAGKGAVSAGLELAGAEAILGKLAKYAPAEMRKRLGMTVTKFLTGSTGEGLTERAQNLVGNFAELMATESPTFKDLFSRAQTLEFWEGLDRGGAESQVLGSLLGTGGSVATAGGTVRRAGRIADLRARRQAEEATAQAAGAPAPPAQAPPLKDVEGRNTVPQETIDAINEGVRALQRPETADEGIERLKRETAVLDERLQRVKGEGPDVKTAAPALETALEGEVLPDTKGPRAELAEKDLPPRPDATENDTPETPEEADRAFLAGLGLTPEQAREVGARMPTTDEVTGYATARHHGPALERAQAWTERTGQPAQYVEIDLHNLGGMNAALGHSGADRVVRQITEAVREHFPEEKGKRVSFIRHGGDELSLVATGYAEEDVSERMERAEAAVSEVVRAAGLGDIPHAKGATDEAGRERRRGAGIFWGTAPIEPGLPLSKTREVADFAVEARKFTRRADDVDRKQAVPSRNPSGPRSGGDSAEDPGGRALRQGDAPESARGERPSADANRQEPLAGSPRGGDPGGVAGGTAADAVRRTAVDTPYARGREAFRKRHGEDGPGLERFLALADVVRQEAADATPEEVHEAAFSLLEDERRLGEPAPRGARVDASAGEADPRDARGRPAPSEGTGREPRASKGAAAPRSVARSFSRPPDPTSRGISLRELSAAVAKVEGSWPSAPEIAVIRDERDLPLEVQEAIGTAKVRGVFHGGRHGTPGAGTVFLLADRVGSLAEAFETLTHEIVGHAGVMGVLGPRGWKAAVREILESRDGRALVDRWTSERGAEYDFDLSTEAGAEGAVGETLAWLAERKLSDPGYTPPSAYRRLVARVRLALRGLARRFGVAPDALSWNEADVDALLARAARHFEGPREEGAAGTWLSRQPEDGGRDQEPALSEAQRRRVEEIVSRTRARLAEEDPRWRRLGEDLARAPEERAGLEEGNPERPDTPTRAGDRTNPDSPTRAGARPDLANPGTEPTGRRLVDEVDSARNEDEEPFRRADAAVNAEADRRLEEDWERERAALLSRGRQGVGLNDVETVTAKKIISAEAFAAMKAGDVQALAETAELVDAYRRTGTEQARAFRMRRDDVMNPRERLAAFVVEAVLRPGDATAERLRTSTPSQRREVLRRHGEQAKATLGRLRARGVDVANLSDEDLSDRFLVARVVREVAAARADLSDKVFEYWANSILSGPLTHMANLTGNTVSLFIEYGLQQPLEMALGTAAGGSRTLAEGRALYGALWRGVVRGSRNAVEAFQTEQRALGEVGDPLAPDRLEARVAIGGKAGRVVRIPYRFLRAADEFYRGLIGEMEAAATAHGMARKEGLSGEAFGARMREILEDGESAAWQAASDRGDLLTFQQELGRYGGLVLSARRKVPGLRYIIPFVTTPANIFKTALRKSPAGAVGSLWRASRGDLSKDEAIRAGAEQLIGLGVIALLAQGVGDGEDEEAWITGTVPFKGSRKGERDLAERTAPPLSVRMGGKWYGYGRLEPLATWLGMTVDGIRGVKEAREGKELDAVLGSTLKRFVGQLEDKTFLDGLGRIIRAIDDGRSAARVVGDVASGFVPAALRQPAQAMEGKVRESRTWGAGPSPKHEGERYESRLARRIAERAAPFAFEGTPKVNAYGLEVEKSNRTFLGRFLSPVQRLDPETFPADVRRIDAAFVTWNKRHPEAPFYPPIPEPRYTLAGRTHYLTDDEYKRLLLRTGIIARKDLRELMERTGGAFTEKGIKDARDIFRKAARDARKSLKGREAGDVEDREGAP